MLAHSVLALHCAPAPDDDGGRASLHTVAPAYYQDFGHPFFAASMTHRVPDAHLQPGAASSTAVCHALLSHGLGAAALATAVPLVSGLIR
ncbi:hypothetical protein ACQCSX_01355 [Pseudarthrobacter sp. P1]|uniref:hypothetical protein n=1 Tax=Pseudarthrobacter sp. P1 TaxID=3418418 RepID=UPI003CF06DEC